MVIKMPKMAHSLYFLLMTAKKIVAVWKKYLSVTEKVLSENGMFDRLWSYGALDTEGRNIQKTVESTLYFQGLISR